MEKAMNNNVNELCTKPADVSDEEWNAIDMHDPLMMVC